MDQETLEFIKERETLHNGSMSYRTYCTWYYNTTGTLRERGVFFYIINNVVYIEDFETQPTFFGLLIKSKKKSNYQKYTDSFNLDDIKRITIVKKTDALKNIIKESSKLAKFFSQNVIAITLENNQTLFFEAMNKNEFILNIKKEKIE